MPKFNGRNKKRIDPRYFLNETVNRDGVDDIDAALLSEDVNRMVKGPGQGKSGKEGKRCTYGRPVPSGKEAVWVKVPDGHLECRLRKKLDEDGVLNGAGRRCKGTKKFNPDDEKCYYPDEMPKPKNGDGEAGFDHAGDINQATR
jgi:hypothetical protein